MKIYKIRRVDDGTFWAVGDKFIKDFLKSKSYDSFEKAKLQQEVRLVFVKNLGKTFNVYGLYPETEIVEYEVIEIKSSHKQDPFIMTNQLKINQLRADHLKNP